MPCYHWALMKTVLRILTLWLILVAVPFQGFAAASMLLCATPQPVQHDHAAMLAGQGDDAHAAHHGQHSGQQPAKCHTSSPCCAGAAPAPVLRVPGASPPLSGRSVPAEPIPPTPVDLALPERPPRPILA